LRNIVGVILLECLINLPHCFVMVERRDGIFCRVRDDLRNQRSFVVAQLTA
jgi:hypothetical protein